VTDEELWFEFTRCPKEKLEALRGQGWDLNHVELDALMSTDVRLWSEVSERIDSRLQRCNLRANEKTNGTT
jgi:hypothetical protein